MVRFGDFNLAKENDDEFVQEVKITKITTHPNYVNGVAYFDIAILEVELVKFTGQVRPICLPSSKNFRVDRFDQVIMVSLQSFEFTRSANM